MSWLAFVNLIQTTVVWEEETSTEELPLSAWPVGMSVRVPSWQPGSPEHIVGNNGAICFMVHGREESKAQVGISTEARALCPPLSLC